MADMFARSGAVAYVLWGILHVVFGAMFIMGALVDPSMLADYGLDALGAQGLAFFAQHGFNLLWVGIFATYVAIKYNWHNNKMGFWLNAVVVSLFDIGFIVFVLIPGHIPIVQGIEGPILWVAGLILTGLAYRKAYVTA